MLSGDFFVFFFRVRLVDYLMLPRTLRMLKCVASTSITKSRKAVVNMKGVIILG